jgi:predicted transcriptional regulator
MLTPNERRLVDLLRGPRLSDKRIREALGLTGDACTRLHHNLRAKLGVTSLNEGLRDFIRRVSLDTLLSTAEEPAR